MCLRARLFRSVNLPTEDNLSGREKRGYQIQGIRYSTEEKLNPGVISGLTFEVTIWDFVTRGHLPSLELNWKQVTDNWEQVTDRRRRT
jgi:hypothetical protein